MKNFYVILVCGLLTIRGFAAEGDGLAQRVQYFVNEIESDLDKEKWSVTSTVSMIIIESKFDIGTYPTVNPVMGSKPTYGKYRFEVHFKPTLTKKEFVDLSLARTKAAAIANYRIEDVNEFIKASKFLENNPLPDFTNTNRFGESYAVYIVNRYGRTAGFTPESAYREVIVAEAVVKMQFLQWPQ